MMPICIAGSTALMAFLLAKNALGAGKTLSYLFSLSALFLYLKFDFTYKSVILIGSALILVLIAEEDLKTCIIPPKYQGLLLLCAIGSFLLSPAHTKRIMAYGLGSSLILIIGLLIFECLLQKDILGGGDMKLIVILGLLTGVNIIFICTGAVLLTQCIKRKGNPMAPGFLLSILFFL